MRHQPWRPFWRKEAFSCPPLLLRGWGAAAGARRDAERAFPLPTEAEPRAARHSAPAPFAEGLDGGAKRSRALWCLAGT